MTTLKVPIAMVFVRAKDGISHYPKEWSDKEDCAEGALVLGNAVLNFDELLKQKSGIRGARLESLIVSVEFEQRLRSPTTDFLSL